MFHKWMNRNWWKVVIGLAITAYLFYHPLTRPIMLAILPLGKGIDDFLVWICLVCLCIIVFFKMFQPAQPKEN